MFLPEEYLLHQIHLLFTLTILHLLRLCLTRNFIFRWLEKAKNFCNAICKWTIHWRIRSTATLSLKWYRVAKVWSILHSLPILSKMSINFLIVWIVSLGWTTRKLKLIAFGVRCFWVCTKLNVYCRRVLSTVMYSWLRLDRQNLSFDFWLRLL